MSSKIDDKIFYNEASAQKLGWGPEWFGLHFFDENLICRIAQFQQEHDLTADGLVGPRTFRRLVAHREAILSDMHEEGNYIICNGNKVEIDWDKTITWLHEDGLSLKDGTFRHVNMKRYPSMFVVHWDVCLSSQSCASVLNKRGISVHFCIDNDGTIYQLLDTVHIGWHAGNSIVNAQSVGVEISNAYYTKYQRVYERRGFGPRPVIEDAKVHGSTLEPHLGFYPVQIEALKALTKALNGYYGIPLKCPVDGDNKMLTTVSEDAAEGEFSGVLHHYHLTRRKIDCAGVDLVEILEDVKEEKD